MKLLFLSAAIAALAACAAACPYHHKPRCPRSVRLTVGTYTYQPWLSSAAGRGVTVATLTRRGFRTRLIANTTTGENPSYCARYRRALYCVNENGEGSVTRVARSGRAKAYKTGAGGSTHIAVLGPYARGKGERVLVANYGGAVTYFTRRGGRLVAHTAEIPKRFAAAKDGQQAEPHPHMVLALPNGRVLVPDLGADRVWEFALGLDGRLYRVRSLRMRAGDGPRHAARYRRSVYVVNEISNTVARITGCSARWTMRECERRPLLDGVSKAVNGYAAAAIRVSADGRFLYASVRRDTGDSPKHGAIVVYKLMRGGAIGARVGVYSSRGVHPRDFSIVERAPDCNSYVAVVNRDSDNLVLMRRNRHTGVIYDKETPKYKLTVKTPTSVLV